MAVDLDPQLMEILACPCPEHAPLRTGTAADPQADALTCTACGRSFPVTDGIPVLLLDEVLPGSGPQADEAQADEAQADEAQSGVPVSPGDAPGRVSGPR